MVEISVFGTFCAQLSQNLLHIDWGVVTLLGVGSRILLSVGIDIRSQWDVVLEVLETLFLSKPTGEGGSEEKEVDQE